MRAPVAIALANALKPGHEWRASAGDLAVQVAGPLLEQCERRAAVDALFVAAPAALLCDGQAHQGALFADRLGLSKLPCLQLEAGDASGAAALHAAVAHVSAGLSRAALVIGVSKVSDRSERERGALCDALIDREVEAPLGLTYQALCGLLADLYVARHGLKAGDLAHVVAKNAANAVAGGETFLPYAPAAIEVRRDIPVAPPLVRSDFAPLLDTATALLVTDGALARELGGPAVEVASLASAGDLTVVADRPEPLRLESVARASSAALSRAGIGKDALAFIEVSSACTILEVLALESAGITESGATTRLYKDGFGRAGSPLVVNPGGGAQGRGFGFGTGGLEQAREAFLQLGAGAGARQVASAAGTALALCLGGVGTHAYATVFRRMTP